MAITNDADQLISIECECNKFQFTKSTERAKVAKFTDDKHCENTSNELRQQFVRFAFTIKVNSSCTANPLTETISIHSSTEQTVACACMCVNLSAKHTIVIHHNAIINYDFNVCSKNRKKKNLFILVD